MKLVTGGRAIPMILRALEAPLVGANDRASPLPRLASGNVNTNHMPDAGVRPSALGPRSARARLHDRLAPVAAPVHARLRLDLLDRGEVVLFRSSSAQTRDSSDVASPQEPVARARNAS